MFDVRTHLFFRFQLTRSWSNQTLSPHQRPRGLSIAESGTPSGDELVSLTSCAWLKEILWFCCCQLLGKAVLLSHDWIYFTLQPVICLWETTIGGWKGSTSILLLLKNCPLAADLWVCLLPSLPLVEMFDDRDVAFGARPRVSGNSFANGANQNCGNSIADIPSTRVAAPPGGKSSLCLGWDDTPPPVPRGRGRARAECPPPTAPGIPPAPAAGAPSGARAAGARGPGPQGGAEAYGVRPRESSNSYASGHNQNTGNVLTGVPTTRVSRPPGGHSQFSLAWDTGPAVGRGRGECAPIPQGGGCSQAPDAFGQRLRVSSNSYANGADQNSGNVLSDTPTTRVLRPPGGGSSLNLGWAWGNKFLATALVA